jgi:molybdopterin converting factor small subunit
MEAVLEVKLPAELEQKARALAEEEGTTLQEVVQHLLEDYITRSKSVEVSEAEKRAAIIQHDLAILERMKQRSIEIGKTVPPGTQAQDVINDIRR